MHPSHLRDHLERKYRRKVLFLCQVGSVNYNLQHEGSDEDYEAFLLPMLEDLYRRRDLADHFTFEEADVKVFFVTHLSNQLEKSNPNFLQLLFSKNLLYLHPNFSWLLDERDKFVMANLPRLYFSYKGMFFEAQNRFHKSLQKGKPNGKALMQMYRVVDFLSRFETNLLDQETGEFTGSVYDKSMTYDDSEREVLLRVRELCSPDTGEFMDRQDMLDLEEQLLELLKSKEAFYKSYDVDQRALDSFRDRLEKSTLSFYVFPSL